MGESDSSSSSGSLGQILMKYRKKVREDRISRKLSIETPQNSNINININMPTSSGSTSVSVSLESELLDNKEKKKTISKKTSNENNLQKKMSKATASKTNTPKGSEADPDFVPKSRHNYLQLSNKELNSIAGRVRVFHETGIVLSDEEDVLPCQNKYKRSRKNTDQPKRRGPQVCGTTYGQGKVGTTHFGYGVRKCSCCNVSKDCCTSKNLQESQTPVSFCEIMEGMSEYMRNQLKQREERFLQVQQRDLLKHPELIELDNSETLPSILPTELSQDKREWVQKFIDSMSADRVDYDKPKQLNIFEGISQKRPSDVHFKDPDPLADSLNAKTIVERIDFEKARRSRMGESQTDEWLKCKNSGKFHTNEVNATSTPRYKNQPISTEESASTLNTVPESNRIPQNLQTKKIYTDQVPSTSAMPDVGQVDCTSNDPLQDWSLRISVMNEDPNVLTSTRIESLVEDYNSDISHLDRSNVTLRTPQSKHKREAGHISIPSSCKPKLPVIQIQESDIMNFVDSLVAAEEESINQEAHERCERMLRTTESARNVLQDALDEVLITSDNSPNRYDDVLDNSIEIIEAVPEAPNIGVVKNDSVQLIESDEDVIPIVNLVDVADTPSTSGPIRSSRRKRTLQGNPVRSAKRRAHGRNAAQLPSICEMASHTAPVDVDASVPTTMSSLRSLRDCSICLENLANKEISSTICGHVFCTPCIRAAVKASRACPNCRTSLTLKKIHPLFI